MFVLPEKRENGEELIVTSYPVRRKIGSSSSPSGEQSWRFKRLSTEEEVKEELKENTYPVRRQAKFGSSSPATVAHQEYKGPNFCIFLLTNNVLYY